jgi:broad specificity phosphatase PhoE
MKIIVIRHGETTGDVEDRYGGDFDDHLTEKGIEQSKAVAEILKGKSMEIIYVSPLARAQETAGIVAASAECPVVVESGVKERNQYGILTGMIKSEAKAKYSAMTEALKDRLNTIEGAESYEDFSQRVSEAFARLASEAKYSCIGIVWHGGPMRVLFRDILKWGELKSISDCAFVELEKTGNEVKLVDSSGIVFGF